MTEWLANSRSGENLWHSFPVNRIRVSIMSYFKNQLVDILSSRRTWLSHRKSWKTFLVSRWRIVYVWCVLKFFLFVLLLTTYYRQELWQQVCSVNFYVIPFREGRQGFYGSETGLLQRSSPPCLPHNSDATLFLPYHLMQNVLNFRYQVGLRYEGVCSLCFL